MNIIGIIPARYQSTRFPGKSLAMIENKPMIQWVVEKANQALDQVWVATDDIRIIKAAEKFGGQAILTSSEHQSGTDRCAEAARLLSKKISFDVVINIQGDEPFIQPEQINLLKACFSGQVDIATLVKRVESLEELFNPNRPKVVIDNEQNALYFSRAAIPFVRGMADDNWLGNCVFWAHIGMYAYRAHVLQKITKLDKGKLEKAESLEQLRWLENGYKIKTTETKHFSIGIDTPEDMENAVQLLKNKLVS